MGAVQLPHDIRGARMCDHVAPGRCTWWCSYRRGVLCITPVLALIVLAAVARWTTAETAEQRDEVLYAFSGVAIFLACILPVVLVLNHRHPEKA
jgi:hypothetical protein